MAKYKNGKAYLIFYFPKLKQIEVTGYYLLADVEGKNEVTKSMKPVVISQESMAVPRNWKLPMRPLFWTLVGHLQPTRFQTESIYRWFFHGCRLVLASVGEGTVGFGHCMLPLFHLLLITLPQWRLIKQEEFRHCATNLSANNNQEKIW